MKYLLGFILVFGLLSTSTQAHCGGCGTDKTHDKTSHSSAKKNLNTIIETAKDAGSFETLLVAIKAAGLSEALSGDGPFTVFAPTDEAFAALPKGTIESLLKDKEKLTSVLTYHVLSGAVNAKDVAKIDNAETLNGQAVSIKVKNNEVMLDNARVITTDIICSNGVIHVIDAVILPKIEKSKS